MKEATNGIRTTTETHFFKLNKREMRPILVGKNRKICKMNVPLVHNTFQVNKRGRGVGEGDDIIHSSIKLF